MDHRTQGGGVEAVHLLGMAKGFRRTGAEVTIVSPPGIEVSADSAVPAAPSPVRRILGRLAKHVPELIFELMEIAYNLPAWFRIRSALRPPPAAALYERYAYFHVAGALAAAAAKVPLILEVNYTVDTSLVRARSRLLRPLGRAAEQFVLRRASLVVPVSTVLRDSLVKSGVPADRVMTVPNAADPERFNPSVSGEPVRARFGLGGARVIGFSGTFAPWHGVGRLIDAITSLLPEHPQAAALLIGDGPERLALEARVRQEGLSDRIRFVGRVGHDQLPDYIAAFDVAVMPDSNEYGSPMKIYEYMAMGKPVVAPRLGPLEDGIIDGVTGILVPARDSPALRRALHELLSNQSRRISMGAKARAHVLEKHTWERNAERVLERLAVPGGAR
jgi:glycosyltransferase involved in cell wall biosynthesis